MMCVYLRVYELDCRIHDACARLRLRPSVAHGPQMTSDDEIAMTRRESLRRATGIAYT